MIYLIEHDARREPQPILKCNINLIDYVKLDNGAAYLGFCHETSNLSNVVLIENWTFESNSKSNMNDPWGGLSLDYKC